MNRAPYFGGDPDKAKVTNIQANTGYFYTMGLNECLTSHPEKIMKRHLKMWQLELSFSLKQFWFCLTGLKKLVYYGVYGYEAEDYLNIYDRYRLQVENLVEQQGYQANVFMVMEEDIKQMAVIFSSGGSPGCPPLELAETINTIGQAIYDQEIFRGDARYCNVTALSRELHGYTDIREGYLETRKLNDLGYFHMKPEVLTSEKITRLRNKADYRIVMGECRQLKQTLDKGSTSLCRKQFDSLYLNTVRKAYQWTLLQDALSYCKHMLELRCTARGLTGVNLEQLCDMTSYLSIDQCARALWNVLERLCVIAQNHGSYQELTLYAIYYIKLHFAEDIALSDVAAYANVNPNYLSGSFQKEMGISLREFITGERVDAAKSLLSETDLKVADIAKKVGIHDVQYFRHVFKKTTGMTPKEYRALPKNRI